MFSFFGLSYRDENQLKKIEVLVFQVHAGLFAAGNTPFMIQNVGGTITRAMTTHMMAAFPSANFHFIDCAEIVRDDVTIERLCPTNGFVRVPEKPGLGLDLDRKALARLKEQNVPVPNSWIVKTTYQNGTVRYNHILMQHLQ